MEHIIVDYVTKIQRMIQSREEINAGIKMIYSEASMAGVDIKALRQVIKLTMNEDDVESHLTTVDEYLKMIKD